VASIAAAIAPVFGQEFRIGSFTVDGGGGRSSGGAFVVEETIGQPDTGVSSGGAFVVEGGFWPGAGVQVVQVAGLPQLRIARASSAIVVVGWDDPADAYGMQEGSSLAGRWFPTARAVAADGDERRVTVFGATGTRFFRLQKKG
jgi:hypothetical protein